MDFMTKLLLFVQFVLVMTNFIGLPGGILSALIPVILFLMGAMSAKFLIGILFVIAIGEAAEFYASFVIGKRYGVDSKGFWASIVGAIVLGIVLAPLFFGLGAVIGTFLGAYLGSLTYELLSGTTSIRAREKAKAMLFGKFLGTFAKIGAGIFALYLEIGYLF